MRGAVTVHMPDLQPVLISSTAGRGGVHMPHVKTLLDHLIQLLQLLLFLQQHDTMISRDPCWTLIT